MALAAVAGVALLGLGLGACGGGTKRAADTSTTTPSSTSAAGTAGPARGSSGSASGSSGSARESSGSAGGTAGTGTAATGAASSSSSAYAHSATGETAAPPGDQDGDSPDNKAFDKDDSFVTTFGRPASPADSRAISSLVIRYYAAIAKSDGATACKLLFFVITESAPETYGQTAFDAAAGRGKSCGPVMSKVYAGSHAELLAKDRHLKIEAIRVQGKRAWVLLRFGPLSVRRLVVYREGSGWKVGELLDTELV